MKLNIHQVIISYFYQFLIYLWNNYFDMETTKRHNYLLNWIEKQQSLGRYTFSLEQLKQDFPNVTDQAINLALSRLSNKGRILSVYKGFYLIVSPEYSSRGVLPPVLFIHQLMQYIGKPYYVGLLSAAALHGAAHQQPQEFFVVTSSKQAPTKRKGLKINYIKKKNIPDNLIEKRKTESGYVHVSNPELTAADLIYYHKRIGGLNRTATVLNELAEAMKPKNINQELMQNVPMATLQRLGFILENILQQNTLSEKLYNQLQKREAKLFRQPLKSGTATNGFPKNEKWKIIININIEIDE